MKIKEVIERTDLTDRAIRLYIENGLVTPNFTENYNGRKNIDFTEDDLHTLLNIATLRKADFSIAEIKSIMESTEKCKEVLQNFLKHKADRIENDTKIINVLSPLLGSDSSDINSICERLNAVTVDKDVPEADTEVPLWEKLERWFFLAVSVLAFGFILIYSGLMLYFYTARYSILYPYGSGLVAIITLPIVIFIIALYYFLQYRRPHKLKTKSKKIVRPVASVLLMIPLGFLVFFTFILTIFSFLDPLIVSQTTDISDYLIVDKHIKIPESFFPEEIPEFAKPEKYVEWLPFEKDNSTEYFYRYENGDGGKAIDIVAEWRVPGYSEDKANYDDVIKKMKKRTTVDGSPPIIKSKGDWTLIYYENTSETNLRFGYTYLIFAYDDFGRMRYIYSFNDITPVANGTTPYYLTLDWYN